MQNFIGWKIKKSLYPDTEIYINENTIIGLRHENETVTLPGQTIYRVIDNDEEENTVVLTDQDGKRYKFDQDELAKALAESSKMAGFQCLQYPKNYIINTSGTKLGELSIYDPRLRTNRPLKQKK